MAYKHLTGKARAENEWFVGELDEHDVRADFVDDASLPTIDELLHEEGVPLPETALAAAKVVSVSAVDVVNASGATTDLANGATRVITATLKHAGQTVTSDDATVVTFAKASGTGTVTGTGTAVVTDGVATKTLTGTGAGTIVVSVSAPGYDSGTTVSFTVLAP